MLSGTFWKSKKQASTINPSKLGQIWPTKVYGLNSTPLYPTSQRAWWVGV